MAIYQYYLAFVPKSGLRKKHDNIPSQIAVSTATGYFDANMDEYWDLAEISFQKIKSDIDKIIDKANWGNSKDSFNWKTSTNETDNDAWMAINSETEKITELSFRADLREPHLKFLNGMLELAQKFEMMVMDRKGNLIKPDFNEVKGFVKMSNTFKFIENPVKFFDGLSDGTISIE